MDSARFQDLEQGTVPGVLYNLPGELQKRDAVITICCDCLISTL